MESHSSEDAYVFSQVEGLIASNARKMIVTLNESWKTLGVDDVTRVSRTRDLVAIVQDRYDEVIEETAERVRQVLGDIGRLREEFVSLRERLDDDAETDYDKQTTLVGKRRVLTEDVDRLKILLEEKTDRIRELNERQRVLSQRLGVPCKTLSERPLPSECTLRDFENRLEEQKDEYEKRVKFFLEKRRIVESLLAELESKEYDSFTHYVVESSCQEFNVTDANMAQLVLVQETLTEQLRQKKTEVIKMRERLDSLWERLMESPTHRAKFSSKHTGHTQATKRALIHEIERCEEKKRENFKVFIEKLRGEIVDMWDKCKYSQLQRDRFVHFHYDQGYDEEILASHEEYLDSLKTFYHENLNIFNLYETRQNLWLKWEELEEKAHEPGRYQNRGGQLLREEKDRKVVSNQLPKIEKELTQLAEEFERRNHKPFTINGHSLISSMEEDWQKKNEKKNKLSVRKQALPRTPMSVPRSAPASNRLLPMLNKETLTAVKRRLSPRNSPHISKNTPSISRRLQFTPKPNSSTLNKSVRSDRKKSNMPVLAVNGCIKKKRSIGRLSQDSKGKKRSRKSKTPSKNEIDHDSDVSKNSTTYLEFQDHIHGNVYNRSSCVNGRSLRSRNFKTEAAKFTPDGQSVCSEDFKENLSPVNHDMKNTHANNYCTPQKHKITQTRNDRDKNIDVNVFATPVRPISKGNKALSVQRQNTVMLASPSVLNKSRNLRRSNSTHNLRSLVNQSPKIKFTSEVRLIM